MLSERVMKQGFEGYLGRHMENVAARVTQQKGCLAYETLKDNSQHNTYVVLTRWDSQEDLDNWLKHPDYKELMDKQHEVLCEEPTYRVLHEPMDEVFLL